MIHYITSHNLDIVAVIMFIAAYIVVSYFVLTSPNPRNLLDEEITEQSKRIAKALWDTEKLASSIKD